MDLKLSLVVLALLSIVAGGRMQAEEITPVFALNAANVGKVVLLMFKPDNVILEVTYSKEKQAELAKITKDGLPKKISISLSGKVVDSRMFTEQSTGHSIKIQMVSLEEAFETIRELWAPKNKPELSP